MTIALWVSACAHLESAPEGTPDGPLGTPGLGEGRVGKLFECFALLQRKSPESLYWVSPLEEAEGYYVTTQFQHLPIRMYSGHEIVIFGKESATYYWMPGAEHDATGSVPLGLYRVAAELPEPGRTVHLRLDKRYPTAFVLVGQGAEPEGSVQRVLPRKLLEWIINEELHELAHYSLNFQLQALRSGLPREQVAAVMADGSVASSCRNISPRLDTALGLLEGALTASGTPGTR
ncbi:hypothetical protein [Cystobacter fuscus]|uniref:hypothetical protein n=1 Tax=Cystobacter fuscus TaxID=43 RepID=UPI000BB31C0F|nr:hypothetical protein [Cystobacter fuscus]